ncbi:hypothetical protein AAGG14_07295 [Enterococcus faecium]
MEELHLFFDDSGVLHRNAPNRFFVYAGYAFIGKDNKEIAKENIKKWFNESKPNEVTEKN